MVEKLVIGKWVCIFLPFFYFSLCVEMIIVRLDEDDVKPLVKKMSNERHSGT
jgi:hypothetical protein